MISEALKILNDWRITNNQWESLLEKSNKENCKLSNRIKILSVLNILQAVMLMILSFIIIKYVY